MDLSLETRHENGHTIIEVGGEIDVYTAPKLRERITELVDDGHYHLVVDLEKVDFLDSTGLGVLVGGLKKLRAHDGSLQLVCTQERLLKIFRITAAHQGLRDPRARRPTRWPRSSAPMPVGVAAHPRRHHRSRSPVTPRWCAPSGSSLPRWPDGPRPARTSSRRSGWRSARPAP